MPKKPKPLPLEGVDPRLLAIAASSTPDPRFDRQSIVDFSDAAAAGTGIDGVAVPSSSPPGVLDAEYWRNLSSLPRDAVVSSSTTFDVFRFLRDGFAEPDPFWRWTPETVTAATKDIPSEHVDYILEAESEDEVEQRRQRVFELSEARERLSSLGAVGAAASVAVSILDPVSLASGAIGVAARGGRLVRALSGGLYATAGTAAQRAATVDISAVEAESDGLSALAMAFAFGGAAGLAFGPRSKLALVANDAAARTEIAAMREAGYELTDAGRSFFQRRREAFKEMLGLGAKDDTATRGAGAGAGDGAGAGSGRSSRRGDGGSAFNDENPLDGQFDPITGLRAFDQVNSLYTGNTSVEPMSFGGRVRLDVVGKLKQSVNPVARNMAAALDIDAVGVGAGGETARLGTAAEKQRRYFRSVMGEAAAGISAAYREYARRQGWGWFRRVRNMPTFYRDFMAYMRSRGEAPDPGGDFAKAAAAWRTSMRAAVARMKEAGVRGAENLEPDDWYVPRLWSAHKVEAAVSKFGEKAVASVIAGALRKAWAAQGDNNLVRLANTVDAPAGRAIPDLGAADIADDIPAEYSERVARAMLDRIRRSGAGLDETGIDVSQPRRERMAALLQEAGVENEVAERILARMYPDGEGSGGPRFDRLKSRTLLDDGYGHQVKNQQTGDDLDYLSVGDMLEDNAAAILARYHSGVASHSAMAELGFQSFNDFSATVRELRAHVGLVRGYTASMADDDIRRLEYLGKRIFGLPVEDVQSDAVRLAKVARDLNFARTMGQAGAANLPDLAVVVAETGWAAVRSHLPGVVAALRAYAKGDVPPELDREMSMLFGVGRHRARDDIVPAYEDLDEMQLMHSSRTDWIGRASALSQFAAKGVADLSGFNFVTDFLQSTAARASVQHLSDFLRGLRLPSDETAVALSDASDNVAFTGMSGGGAPKMSARRLAAYGITEGDAAAWEKLFRKHAELDERGVVLKLNYEQMRADNPEAFGRLVDYLDRRIHTMVLEPTPGMLHEFFGTTAGKIFMQFRSFGFASTYAHTLQSVAVADRVAAAKLVYGMAAAGAVYVMQTHVRSLGRSDRDEYLKTRLEPVEVLKAAFQRSAVAGLTPSLIDTTVGMVTPDPVFAYGRTTELASGFIAGNPTVDLVSDIVKTVQAPGQAIFSSERQLSERDLKTAFGVLPFQNVWGVQNVLQLLASPLPETARQTSE